jgi:hypothetical protein
MDALGRARLSLDGLSVGDAFGERFFGPSGEVLKRISRRELPDAPWTYTDDTEMALSIVEILEERGGIDQDVLAARFAGRMRFNRNYGQGTYAVLCGVKEGLDWRLLTQIGFLPGERRRCGHRYRPGNSDRGRAGGRRRHDGSRSDPRSARCRALPTWRPPQLDRTLPAFRSSY